MEGALSSHQVYSVLAGCPQCLVYAHAVLNITAGQKQVLACLPDELRVQAGTLTPKDPSAGTLTLTGWSAALGLVALMAVAVGGGVMAFRRYKGWDQLKGYTLVQKDTRRGST